MAVITIKTDRMKIIFFKLAIINRESMKCLDEAKRVNDIWVSDDIQVFL